MHTIHVGSPHEISIVELARAVVREIAPGAEIQVAKRPAPGAPTARYVPTTDRAAGLGLRPWVSLEDGIQRTCEWHERIRAGNGAGS